MLFIIKHSVLKCIFFGGVTFFWLLIRIILWREYCPTFICDPFDGVQNIYDYVIVGAGTAGSIVALRLAAMHNASVLLIEAGPTGGSVLDIPAALPLLQLSAVDWNYKTVPQEYAAKGMHNNIVNWPRGKLVGGTGRFNNMMYVRGSQADYKEWYKDKPDYNYEQDILTYFKKSENHLGAYRTDTKHHGTDGPLYVDDIPFTTDLSQAILETVHLMGFPVRDINGEHSTGFFIPQANIKDGARYSTGHYLLDHMPKNLKLVTNVFTERILFKKGFEARGVKVAKFGTKKILKARKGVILAAGTIDTAKLLMLSGIGKKKDLKQLKIPVIRDLPVGDNLQDHVSTGLDLITLETSLALNPISLISPYTIYSYKINGSGPFSSIQCEVVGTVHTDCIDIADFDGCCLKQTSPPNLQFLVLPMGVTSDNGAHLRDIIGLSYSVWENYMRPLVGTPTLSILPVVLKPKSRGFIKLASKDPYVDPLIDPRYLSNKYDVEVLLKGIEMVKRFIQSQPMKTLGANFYELPLPGCEKFAFNTKHYWECYVRHITLTVYHPVGTAKMGHPRDKTSVVDYDFKVIGLNKLFVADASVMPQIPSANTNAPTVLIAEKAADSVKFQEYLNAGKCESQYIFNEHNFCDIL